jgi:hypothetical protein
MKDKKYATFFIKKEIHDKFREYAKQEAFNQSRLIEKLMTEYLKKKKVVKK